MLLVTSRVLLLEDDENSGGRVRAAVRTDCPTTAIANLLVASCSWYDHRSHPQRLYNKIACYQHKSTCKSSNSLQVSRIRLEVPNDAPTTLLRACLARVGCLLDYQAHLLGAFGRQNRRGIISSLLTLS